jgi:hypothetical protein
VPRSCKKPSHSSGSFLLTQKLKNNGINYHHYYSSVPSGGPRAIEGRTCDASKSEVGRARIQRASTRSFVRAVLFLDPSSSSLASSSKKCDKKTTNDDRVLADPVSSCGIDLALEHLHYRGQRCYQGRRPVGLVQHQVPGPCNQSPQGLQLSIHLSPRSQLHPKLSDGPMKMIIQSGPIGW